tara:strand:- start:577 stop:1116 length:540 start_codon:yes stop_codon:yes gene_type:complete
MDKAEELIKNYLGQNLGNSEKSPFCLSDEFLMDYFQHELDKEDCDKAEKHIASCGFCLSRLNLVFEAGKINKTTNIPVPDNLIKAAKDLVKDDRNSKNRKIKKNLFLLGAIIPFVLSFFIPKYFMQFLVVTLILGMRWAFESESGRTLIMVLDSWRKHSHDDDDETSQRLRDRSKSYHK